MHFIGALLVLLFSIGASEETTTVIQREARGHGSSFPEVVQSDLIVGYGYRETVFCNDNMHRLIPPHTKISYESTSSTEGRTELLNEEVELLSQIFRF